MTAGRAARAPRVLLVDSGGSWRGGQRQVAALALALHERGVASHLWVPDGSPLADWAQDHGLGVTAHSAPRNDLSLAAAASLRRTAAVWSPTVVHAHDARAHAVARLAQLLGLDAPLVVTRRVTRTPRGKWKYGRGVSRYIAISDAVRSALVRAGIPWRRIWRIPSGVAVPRDERPADLRHLGIGPGTAVIAVLGALTPEKGVATGIAAATDGGSERRWLVIGDGPERGGLERLARQLHAPVTFMGFVADPGPLLQRADLLVHTPRTEGLGGAVLEAAVRGTPVIASDVGGIREVVRPETGTLVPVDRPAAVRAAVASWITRPARRVRARAAAARTARRFAIEAMVTRTMETYGGIDG